MTDFIFRYERRGAGLKMRWPHKKDYVPNSDHGQYVNGSHTNIGGTVVETSSIGGVVQDWNPPPKQEVGYESLHTNVHEAIVCGQQ